jgi:hypothetical protein
MLEKFNFKKIAPLVASAAIGAGATLLINPSGKIENNHESKASISNVETTKYQAEPGSIQTIDISKEIPSYRYEDLKRGESACTILGSNDGKIDSKQILKNIGDTNLSVEIKIPSLVQGGYDGSSGYGYFILCGDDKKVKGQFEINYTKRIVYHVLPADQQINDNKTTFEIE